MNQTQLRNELGIKKKQLDEWIDAGLPWSPGKRKGSKDFDPDAVAAWLVETGRMEIDEPAETIYNTRADAARHFGVSDRTISTWQTMPGFPGKPGTAGKRDGYYPANQIAAWRDQHLAAGSGSTDDPVNHEIKVERLRKLRLSNDEAAGNLVDLEEYRRFAVHQISLARREIKNLPAEILQTLPAELPDVTRQECRRKINERIDSFFQTLGKLTHGPKRKNKTDPGTAVDP